MSSDFQVILDACVLVNAALRDTLLRLAEPPCSLYAVTSHSAQGLTAERVLIHADTSVHPDLLNSRFGYVAVSRASHEATIFTNDVNRLAQQLGSEVTKTAALEITPSIHWTGVRNGLIKCREFNGLRLQKIATGSFVGGV